MAEHAFNKAAELNPERSSELSAEQLITENLDIWTSAIEQKSASGRGSSKKFSLHGIKKLRELILELAVRGKLVPQDESDEPASVLLERIAAEKAQLVKDKKIKKPKALPEISEDEKPFELPKGWGFQHLGDLGVVGSSSRVQKKDWQDSGVPFYRAREIIKLSVNGTVDNDLHISNELFLELSKSGTAPEPEDIMITGVGTIGVPYVVTPNDKFYFKDASVLIFKNIAKLYPLYLDIFMKSPLWNRDIHKDSMGTTVHTLTIVRANSVIVPVPPCEEQQRIVAKVDELMSLCDALEAQTEASITAHQTLVETLLGALLLPSADANSPEQVDSPEPSFDNSPERHFRESWQRVAEHFDTLFTTSASIDTLKQTILQLAVMGKLVPQDTNDEPAAKLLERIAAEKAQLIADKKIKKQKPLPAITDEEKPFELPQGWEWCKFGLLSEFLNGDRGKNYPNKSEYVEAGIPWINTGHIEPNGTLTTQNMNYITKEKFDSLRSGKVLPNDLVYCLRGATFGKTAFVKPYSEGAIASSLMIIRAYDTRLNDFIYRYLTSAFGRSQIFRFDNGSAQPNLSANSVGLYAFPCPPLKEQKRIVAKVDELMALCDQLKARLADAQTTQLHLTDAIVEQAV
ncbi:restriction endonuclease subunit S [Shewanella pneumatophori]|uniref:Restriction endonuclease subunit S n=1 Tax=Shewanella pneumatophori TaxID=314092 RepID=A0A9X1ZJZ5_9GAMM|nr:restriction endonuclease subunit S [Shewanella pneumatophori]MCL1140875.1 restriction endonuclease subunit S [Shewanella pneumatophori]